MDANLIHDIIFYVMYAALAIAVVILVERGLYFFVGPASGFALKGADAGRSPRVGSAGIADRPQ